MDALEHIPSALEAHPAVMLATVIGTSGSTPAVVLSRMLVAPGRTRLAGTIGGGCIESDVIAAADELCAAGRSAIMTFTLTEDHPESGMLCGGTLNVFIEPVLKSDAAFVAALLERRESGEDTIRGTASRHDGTMLGRFMLLVDAAGKLAAGRGVDPVQALPGPLRARSSFVLDVAAETALAGGARQLELEDATVVLERLRGAPALLLFGGGHVSLAVCRIAALAGFRVTVIDDRPEYASAARFPDAARTMAVDFLAAFPQLNVRPSASIVIVTRGHKADELVLYESMKTQAGYVGMIGSRKKVAATFERLIAGGVSADLLRRVRAPIGVDIGAATPEEIAVSIVAELIHHRRIPGVPLRFKSNR